MQSSRLAMKLPITSLLLLLFLGMGWCGAESRAADNLPTNPQPPTPRRVVSICLPGDQLLLQLARPEEIVAVSWLAHDADLSPRWDAARHHTATRGTAEELVLLKPDLVFAGSFTTPATRAVLKQLGVPVVEFGVPTQFEELRAQIRLAAGALGGEAVAKGAAIIANMDARLQALKDDNARRPTALFYYQDGFTPGEGTFADAMLQAAGYRNLGVEFARQNPVSTALERVLLAKPDLLILSRYKEESPTFREITGRHPLFRALPGMKRVSYPFRQLDCPDPLNLEMIEELHALRATLP